MAAVNQYRVYPVGTPGTPWTEAERTQWREQQEKKRDYFTDVVSQVLRLRGAEVVQYGSLDYRKYNMANYPLYAIKSKNWDAARPMVLVTGGVHGYETSGVHGALLFASRHLAAYSEKVNVLVLPCVSPWGYETVNRWTPEAVDPNRSFCPSAPGSAESAAAMAVVAQHAKASSCVLMHTDLHETTDTDNSEFIPAKTARDGAPTPEWDPIPDGFYLVGDTKNPGFDFQKAIIEAVAKVTHIAEADERGTIIGVKVDHHGIICYDKKALHLCGGHTDAKYTTTTEVYPDSARATPEQCNEAQVAVVTTGIEFALSH